MDAVKLLKESRGGGGGRGGGRGSRGGGSSRGRGGTAARGRGRGRGRGRTPVKDYNTDLTEDDEICNRALAEAELNNSAIAKAFKDINEKTELDGFNETSGNLWIYPTNRDVRDYQFKIVETALFHNTLVSLPTGLGKTFISAVVMYNFQRWYPNGIIVFMAPTRPLVKQQLDACHNTVGISPAKTVELTGSIQPPKRKKLWETKTVFFLTPQVMISDLNREFFNPKNVRCIVVDEAHRALGDHAYVQVIKKIVEENKLFRVLALSATPGSDLLQVQQVLANLLISRVELRTEDSPDVAPYIHTKNVEKIVVHIEGYLKQVLNRFTEVFQFYTGKLMKAGVLTGRDASSFGKYHLIKTREVFRNGMGKSLPSYQKGLFESDFAVCMSLAHANEILTTHGLRAFYTFLDGVLNGEKSSGCVRAELRKNEALKNILKEIQEKLNISSANSKFDFSRSNYSLFSAVGDDSANDSLNSSSSFNYSMNYSHDVDYTLSHPKLKTLKAIIHRHFLEYQSRAQNTRVMIFSQLRDSVQEIGNMLNSLQPLVKPMIFVGKAEAGFNQKNQANVVQKFRSGDFNVLVSTSVGEEGLDIGEVDLIVCFDSDKSPTRLIQRMGRTGRQRDGKVIFLLTAGKEDRGNAASFQKHNSISKSITDSRKLQSYLYKESPRMIPKDQKVECYKMSVILSTEQNPNADQNIIDLTQDDSDTGDQPVPKKPKVAQKSAPKKVKAPVENTISKMFENLRNQEPRSVLQQQNILPPEFVPYFDTPMDYNNYDDGVLLAPLRDDRAFSRSSVYNRIFGMESEDRRSVKPCTTFAMKQVPSTSSMGFGLESNRHLRGITFTNQKVRSMQQNLQHRRQFDYGVEDACHCGNAKENRPHYHVIVGEDHDSGEVIMELNPVTGELVPKTQRDLFKTVFPGSSKLIDLVCHNYQAKLSRLNNATQNRMRTSLSPLRKASIKNKSETIVRPPPESEDEELAFGEDLDELPPSPEVGISQYKYNHGPVTLQEIEEMKEMCRIPPQNAATKVSTPKPKEDTSSDSSSSSSTTSDDDSDSEFPQSPEISENKLYKEFKERRQAQNFQTNQRISSSAVEHRSPLQQRNIENSAVFEQSNEIDPSETDVLNSSSGQTFRMSRRRLKVPSPIFKDPETDSDDDDFKSPPPFQQSRKRLFILPKDVYQPNPASKSMKVVQHQDWIDAGNFTARNTGPSSTSTRKGKEVCPKVAKPNLSSYQQPSATATHSASFLPPRTKGNPALRIFPGSTGSVSHKGIFNSPKIPKPAAASTAPACASGMPVESILCDIPGPSTSFGSSAFKKPCTNPRSTLQQNHTSLSTSSSSSRMTSPVTSANSSFLTTPRFLSPTIRTSSPVRGGPRQPVRFLESPPQDSQPPIITLDDSPIARVNPRRKVIRFKARNPFLATQADVECDEDEISNEGNDLNEDEYDQDDSFVDDEESSVVTLSQQAMYLQSVRDAPPVPYGRVERPLSPAPTEFCDTEANTTDEQYNEDSFCQDEVEFMDQGVYTQAMNQAKIDIAQGLGASGYQTRRRRQQEQHFGAAAGGTFKEPKLRRRVYTLDDDDSSEED